MNRLLEKLMADQPVILDGAWGTQMQAQGLPVGAHPDAWNLSNPDKVEIVPRAYAEAGSQIVLTNTFGATRHCLKRHGLDEQAVEINRLGAEISKRAAGDRSYVFGSIGPSGAMLMMGEITPDDLKAMFTEQAQALADGGADGLVIETMSDPAEAVLAVEAAKTTGLPVVGCMVFDSGKDCDRTMMGTTPEEAVQKLTDAGADVIGSNCGQGIAGFVPICRRMRAVTDLPLWMKANAGLPEMVDGAASYAQTPEEFANSAKELVEAGANLIGGCCGTSPDFIRALCKALK